MVVIEDKIKKMRTEYSNRIGKKLLNILDKSSESLSDLVDENGTRIVKVEDLKDDKLISEMEASMKDFKSELK